MKTINRRHLLQRLTAITLGSALLPAAANARNSLLTTEDPKAIFLAPGAGKKGKVGDMDIIFKLDRSQTSGHLAVWETIIQPGELGAPPHYHENYDELCRVLEGSVFIMTDDEVTEVKAGGWHLRPRGIVHTFWNSSKKQAKTIDFSVPGGHENYMQDLAALFENNNHPKPDDFTKLAAKHDIHYRFDLLEGIMKKFKVKL